MLHRDATYVALQIWFFFSNCYLCIAYNFVRVATGYIVVVCAQDNH